MTLSALETSLSKQSQHPILVTKANIWCATVMAKGLVEPPIVTNRMYAVADPGFPVLGGGGIEPLAGCRPLTWVLFGKNVCENERIESCWGGGHRQHPLDPPMVCVLAYMTFEVFGNNIFLEG